MTPPPARTHFSTENSLKKASFQSCCLHVLRNSCTFALFFMVLDLRLVKIGCRETINFFCTYTKNRERQDVSPQIYRRNKIIRQLNFLKTSLSCTAPIFWNRNPTPHSAPPCRACMVGLSTNRAYWLLANPPPRANVPRPRHTRITTQTRLHLAPDAVASRPACANNHYPRFSFAPSNLPTYKRSGYQTEGRDNKSSRR